MKGTATGAEIAKAVRSGSVTAASVVDAALDRIQRLNPRLGAFTTVTDTRARDAANGVDVAVAAGKDLPLAGVPFAVKNLFDLEGIPTRAGSLINRERAPATADATLVSRLEAAGAICVGALNMGEYAYDFTGENAHDGPSRNPHDLRHMSGGSSGGSGTATAAGLVPMTLGSDTNGSIRVPSSLCGLFGLKPTYGRLSRHGTFPFVASIDHLGPLARTVTDLALSYDAMQGYDENDPAQANRAAEPTIPTLDAGLSGLRIAIAGDYFAGTAEPREVVSHVAQAIGASRKVTIPDADKARAGAYLISMSEGAALHLERLRSRPQDFDPDVRDRLLAGTLLPAAWVNRAHKYRRVFRQKMIDLFGTVDAILAPATPLRAPRLGQKTAVINGMELPVRPNLGIFTQPISFAGLPVVAVPVWLPGAHLPLGVQIITAPWREDLALRIARELELLGAVTAPVAHEFADA